MSPRILIQMHRVGETKKKRPSRTFIPTSLTATALTG